MDMYNTTLRKCDKNAKCKNTIGSYYCECKEGFVGDGYECQGNFFLPYSIFATFLELQIEILLIGKVWDNNVIYPVELLVSVSFT